MPGTLVDRLPLPNLKVYTTGSVLVLSIAVYYALNVTSDPNWRLNSTVQRQEAMAEVEDGVKTLPPVVPLPVLDSNGTRNFTEQFVDVMTFMMQEPLCMWTVINIAYCSLALFGFLIQRVVFGQLRVAEAQRVKDKFWNYVFYKFIFVFGVINVQYMDEVMLWCSWFTLVGFLHLLGQLCKDRFEYLSSSPNTGRWAHVRLLSLLTGILAASLALLLVAVAWGLPAGRDIFAFMAAECVLVLVCALHVCARYVLQLYNADVAGPVAYYTHLVFDAVSLVVELAHVVHMVVYSNMLVSMASLVLLMQLRHLLHELQARARRHRLYTSLATHMSRNYPMASKEEVEKNQDNCAICWEPMKEARKLPCSHLFHNSCLCQWVQQDASCPTCRRALSAGTITASATTTTTTTTTTATATNPTATATTAPGDQLPPPRQPNHFFHFDGSRYVSWLPSFSVEVTRVRAEPALSLSAAHLDALARQVQQMFPQYGVATLAADLAATRSADLTLDNILEGRLAPLAHLPHTDTPASLVHRLPHAGVMSGATPTTASSEERGSPEMVQYGGEASGSSSAAVSTHFEDYSEEAGGRFPDVAAERERALRRRKEMLLATARNNYLRRTRLTATANTATATATATAATATATAGPAPPAPHARDT